MRKVLLAVLLVFGVVALKAQTLSVIQTAPYDLSTTDSTLSLLLTMKLEGQGNFADLHIQGDHPVSVNQSGSPRQELIGAFEVKQLGKTNQLQVKVHLLKLPVIATYEVSIGYWFGANAGKAGTFSFNVARPAAVLGCDNAPAAGLSGQAPYHSQITLRETGGRAAVLQLKPMPVSVDKYGEAGLLVFDRQTYTVPAGGSLVLDYHPDEKKIDDLPIGVYQTKLNLTSNSLSGGFTVNIEVANKRGKWWIIVLVLGGLVSGFLVRTLLKNKTDSEQVHLSSLLLEKQINEDSKDIHDTDFQAKVNTIIAGMQQQFLPQPGQPLPVIATLTKAVSDARDAYNTERKNFYADLKTVSDNYDLFAHPVFDPALPAVIAGQLKAVRTTLLQMKKYLDDLDVKNAKVAYGDAGVQFNKFVTTYQLYMNGVASFVAGGSFWPAVASTATKNAFTQEGTNIQTLSNSLQPTATTYQQTLATVTQLQTLADGLGNSVEALLLGDYQKTNAAAAGNAGFLAALKSFADGFRNMAINTPPQNQAAAHFSATLLANLDNAWNAAVTPPNMQQLAGFLAGAMPLAGVFPHSGSINAAVANHSGMINFLLRRHSTPQSLGAAITRSLRRYYILNAIQTVLLTLLICLMAYKLYGDAWIGKFPDMIGLFLGAFSLDIAASSITDLKSKVL